MGTDCLLPRGEKKMALRPIEVDSLLHRGFSRRQLGRIAALLTAGASFPFYNESAMAQQAERHVRLGPRGEADPEYVRINQNENPMGPCKEGLEAIARVAPNGWRYNPSGEQAELVSTIAAAEDIPEACIAIYPGSSDALIRAACVFTSPTRGWTMATPGYGGGAPAFIGSKLTQVPLRPDYSHDAEGMIEADPTAGAYYVVNPNNPTATLTPHKDIEYLLANKQKDGVVIVDEAYIHFSEKAQPCTDLVRAGKDVVVMRTFSKIYGMAGLRAGFVMARPDLLNKLRFGANFMNVTAVACATASLKTPTLVPERRAAMRRLREETLEYLEGKGVKVIPSEANFFMMEVNRPHRQFADAMAANKVIVGRPWPVWPTKVRVTIGTAEEMARFRAAFETVWA
jgi:histidinol-phosphate/aromatic aminotransferase/cobyric acid decarboxylase-like protein